MRKRPQKQKCYSSRSATHAVFLKISTWISSTRSNRKSNTKSPQTADKEIETCLLYSGLKRIFRCLLSQRWKENCRQSWTALKEISSCTSGLLWYGNRTCDTNRFSMKCTLISLQSQKGHKWLKSKTHGQSMQRTNVCISQRSDLELTWILSKNIEYSLHQPQHVHPACTHLR